MHGCDHWTVEYANGETHSSETAEWQQIATLQSLGEFSAYVTTQPVSRLSTMIYSHPYTLTPEMCPYPVDGHDAYAFRLYHSRSGEGTDRLIGYQFGLVFLNLRMYWLVTANFERNRLISDLHFYQNPANLLVMKINKDTLASPFGE